MQDQQLATLIEKYASGQASPEEVRELTEWYRQKAYQDAVFPDDEEAVGLRILARLNQEINPPKKKAGYGWYAAVVVLLISAGSYFLLMPSPQPVPVAAVTKPEPIVPGANKAILTLAGGKRIVLNAAGNGTLASQAGSVVSKTADGSLVYAPSKDKVRALAYNTLSTPRGGQYNLTLPDGTQVWLNAASSLTYPTIFNGEERQVKLTGEAYFEVADNPEKPFKVDVAGRQQVVVLGTHFNIEAYPEDERINTTLLEGAVKLISGRQHIMMKPGEMVTGSLSGALTRQPADQEAVMAWKNGLFVFKDEGIQSAMQKAARWYDVDVECRDGVDKMRLGGVISRFETITELLDKITKTNGIHYEIKGRKVILFK